MPTRLERLQTLCDRLEAEQLEAVEMLASAAPPLAAAPADSVRRIADLQAVLSAVRDQIARHAPRMGYGPDTLAIDEAATG
jgi:hypothetical protein